MHSGDSGKIKKEKAGNPSLRTAFLYVCRAFAKIKPNYKVIPCTVNGRYITYMKKWTLYYLHEWYTERPVAVECSTFTSRPH